MAHKRMFSKDITGSDAFREMPSSSQALYFHLGMDADDDGFLANYKGLIKTINAGEDDLKILIAKRFLILFPSKVIVVKHWKINNTVRIDRYKETRYLDEKKALIVKENGAYTEGKSFGIPSGNHLATQKRIGKDRIGEESMAETSSAPFSFKEEIQTLEASPRRDLNIIAMYFEEKKPDLKNKAQLSVAIKRHLRAAKSLVPFTDNQILDAVPKAKKITDDWVLETLVKILTK